VGQIAFVLSGCGIAFVFVEVGLRLFGISYPYFYIPDELTGFSLKPGAEGLWHKEGETYITINRAGFRDREHRLEKGPGTFRIAVLGDSFTEALQVPMEETYWNRIEHELSGCPALDKREVEVVNFGVGGYSPAQELLVLRHKVPLYQPDLVLQALFTGNDITGNSKELDSNNMRPYFMRKDGRLVIDNSFRDSTTFWIQQLLLSSEVFESSRVLQVFREARYKLQTYLHQVEHQKRMKDRIGSDIGLKAMLYLEPTDPVWDNAWEITEQLILLMKREVEEGGSRFLLVSLSNPEQVHPDLQHRQTLARQLGVPDLFYPDRRLQALAKREGIELLSLAEPLAVYAEQHGAFLHGFQNAQMGQGHWNASAHQLAGHLMSERICGKLVSREPVVPGQSRPLIASDTIYR
jgi:hypothetical protein